MEDDQPLKPFTREQQLYRAARRGSPSWIDRAVPWGFALLYAVMIAATQMKPWAAEAAFS